MASPAEAWEGKQRTWSSTGTLPVPERPRQDFARPVHTHVAFSAGPSPRRFLPPGPSHGRWLRHGPDPEVGPCRAEPSPAAFALHNKDVRSVNVCGFGLIRGCLSTEVNRKTLGQAPNARLGSLLSLTSAASGPFLPGQAV